jgi:hypothetical protein
MLDKQMRPSSDKQPRFFIHSLINGSTALCWALASLFFSFVIFFTQLVRLLGQVMSLSQGR